ncbi:MAG: carboxypeptidase regulatory-like domain-containing protein, partial [Acidobacteria bacterium]|nr:carboxypeptidase regulatory-like domain-containing protein [Acidobacteriota bacterium]
MVASAEVHAAPGSWRGALHDADGHSVANALIELHATSGNHDYSNKTSETGKFVFGEIAAGTYTLRVTVGAKIWISANVVTFKDDDTISGVLELSGTDATLRVIAGGEDKRKQGSGGENLSSGEVSSLPLNERDFSKLLLLAAGTMTDTNGAANFTQQFAVNGQRGVASVFAMDGVDTSDPELGGATFSNFNVDAIQEVQSSSGVMSADIGHGAAGFINVVTKSGNDFVHGSAFEFVRNAAFDARNFFDHSSSIDPRRIPPFARNEFGVTNGGPLVLPKIYDGRGKTFYFAEYQGFRQVLGTTQVFAVPTAAERQGIDTTTVPGDTLFVPVSAKIAPILARYPLPNEPSGPYGARTYATSSKVVTDTDQFSIRVDHKISDKANLFTRFSLNQVNGPTTNPDQTAIDSDFGIKFFDHQRNAAVRYTRVLSPRMTSATSFGYIRSTPTFPTTNQTDPSISYGDGLYEGFNTADGSIYGSFGNVYQTKEDLTYAHGSHSFKFGAEIRLNKDA